MDANDAGGAADAYLDFLRRYEPAEAQLGPSGVPATPEDRQVARTFAGIHAVCARMLNAAGRPDEARAETEKANRWFQVADR